MGRPKGSKNKPKVAAQADVENKGPVGNRQQIDAQREDAGGQAVLNTVERTEHGKKLEADMKAKGVKKALPVGCVYARAVRPGDKLLSVDGDPLKPEWQDVEKVFIVEEMGGEIVVVLGKGEVKHKLSADSECAIERK